MLFCSSGVFAQESIAVLDTAGDKILKLISSKWVKAVLCVALVIEFGVVAFGNAQGVNFFFSNVSQESLGMISEPVNEFLSFVSSIA